VQDLDRRDDERWCRRIVEHEAAGEVSDRKRDPDCCSRQREELRHARALALRLADHDGHAAFREGSHLPGRELGVLVKGRRHARTEAKRPAAGGAEGMQLDRRTGARRQRLTIRYPTEGYLECVACAATNPRPRGRMIFDSERT